MSPSSHTAHPLLRNRATVALIALLALMFTGLSVSQAHAAAAPQGSYTGTSTAYTDATVDFSIDANGNMSGFSTTSYCSDGLFTNPVSWAGMPATAVEAGVPFDIEWEYDTGDVSPYYELTGTVNADGTASGTGRAGFLPYGTCGGAEFHWTASTEVEDPDPVYDPEVSVSPSSLTESELADSGVDVTVSGFPAEVSVEVTVGTSQGETVTTGTDGSAVLSGYTTGALGVGDHSVTAAYGGLSASATFTVTADAPVYNPQISVTPSVITESEVAESGVTVAVTGFPANTEISVGVPAGEFGSMVETDNNGAATMPAFYLGSLGPGTYAIVASYDDLTASADVTITEDDVDPVYDPQISVSPSTLTVSEADENGVDITVTGFPADTEISVGVIENQLGQTVQTDQDGSAFLESYGLGGVSPGQYTVSASYEDLSAQTTVTITEDDEDPVYDPQVSVSPTTLTLSEALEDGVEVSVTGFPAETEIAVGVVETQSGEVIETDADGSVFYESYALGGIGVGNYTVRASYGDLIAEATVTVTEDDPVYDPQASVNPSSLTESALADSGVTITGSDFPADASVTLTVAGNAEGTETADANGDVEFDFTSDSLGTGSHTAVLTSDDLSASASFTVTEDAPAYDPQASVSPSTVTESELAESGVTVIGSDFPANEVVNLAVDGADAGSQTADADGTVAIGYTSEALAPGTYTVQLANGDLTADASFTVEADPAPVYNPEISLSTTEVTESALASDGVGVVGTGFPANAPVTLSVAGEEVVTHDSDADGNVAFTFWGENIGPGEYIVRLAADAEGAQVETTITVVADEDTDPVTIPATQPNPDDLDPALEGEIQVPATAEPGEPIVITLDGVDAGTEVGVWIFSDPAYLGTQTVDANGQVTVTIPTAITAGTHTISVWTEAGLVGWDSIVITAADDDGPGVTDPDPTDPDAGTDGTTNTGDQLAVTGGTLAVGTLAGGALLLLIGFGLVMLARTRGQVIA